MSNSGQARKIIGEAIRARKHGVTRISEECGVHYTRLLAFLNGARLLEPTAGKLRAALPEVPEVVWADAFAPLPATDADSDEAAAS